MVNSLRKSGSGSAFVDAQDQLDQQLKDAGMDSKGRIGYTNKRGRFVKKGERNRTGSILKS